MKINKPFLIVLTTLIFLLFCPQLGQRFLLQDFTPYDYHRLLELGILLFTSIGLICIPSQASSWLNSFSLFKASTKLIILMFFLLGMISALCSANISTGLLWVGHNALLFIFGITIASIIKNAPEKSHQYILSGLMLIVCLYLFWEWGNTLTILFKSYAHLPFNTDKAIQALRFPGYSNPRFLGQVLAFTFPLIVVPSIYFWEKRKIGMSILLMCLAAGWWQMLWMNQSRALYLVVIVLGIGAIFLFRKHAFKWLTFQGIALLGGLIVYIVLFHLAYHIPERSSHSFTQDSRLALWLITLKLIWHHLLLGVGPMNFAPYGLPFNVSHPHNAILYIAVEWGTPAALLFIGLTCSGCFRWFAFAKHHASPLNIALTGSIIAGITDAQFSGVLLMPVSQIVMAIVCGWLLGTNQSHYYSSQFMANMQNAVNPSMGARARISCSRSFAIGHKFRQIDHACHPDDATGIRQDPSEVGRISASRNPTKSHNAGLRSANPTYIRKIKPGMTALVITIIIAAALTIQGLSSKIFNLPAIESQLCAQQFKHSDKCLLIPSYWGNGKV